MRQRIERVCFEDLTMKGLVKQINEFTATVSVGNLMDTTITEIHVGTQTEKIKVDRQKEATNETYNYVFTAVVTVLHEE